MEPTGFFQYNGIGLANGLYRRIRKDDDDTASSEPFVERVTEEVHKHHSSRVTPAACALPTGLPWRGAHRESGHG